MRIGMFTDSYFPRKDGCSYTVKLWKERLERRGHEVYVVYPEHPEYQPQEGEIPVKSVPDPSYQGHRYPILLGTKNFPELDVVHCHTPGLIDFTARYYAWKKNIPSVFSFHTPLEDYAEEVFKSKVLSKIIGRVFIRLETAFLSTFDVVTSNTENLERRDVDSTEIPAGIDMEFFKPTESKFVQENDLKKPVAAYSGRLSEEKNIETIIDMAEDFEGTVLIVGNGRHEEELKKRAGDNIVFKDFLPREKLPEFYSSIDVFVHASGSDTFSLTTLEANACGTPVVAPNVFPFNETIKQKNGRRYEYQNSEDMLEKIREVLNTSFKTRNAAEKYSAEKSIDKLEQIYQELGHSRN